MGRILLIEDDAGSQLLFKNRLEDLGYAVDVAPTGAIGLMETRAKRYDLFLVDIGLGSGIDGYEVCRRLKAIPQLHSVPVVLISGQVKSREELHRGYEAGCETYLVKGDLTLLEDVVRAMLRLKTLQDEMALQNRLLEEQNRRLQAERQRGADLEVALRETGSRGRVFRELAAGRPDGLLLVDQDGVVRHSDRGAQDLFGKGLEGKHLASLAPDSRLEAFVRDARTEVREAYRFDVGGRSYSAAVLPIVPRGDSAEVPLRVVLILDASKRRIAAELLRVADQGFPRREVGPLVEAARRVFRPSRIVGRTPAMREVRRSVKVLAGSDDPVLVRGEPGTGKEHVVRSIHFGGSRSGPFVPINCGSISPSLVEAELFGHTKGAFAEALADRPGIFQQADRGTVFLEEVTELPLEAQGQLLRVLAQGEVYRIGSKTPERVDVRIVATSSRDVDALAEQGRFLGELLVRMSVLGLPPIRERRDDVELLARHFVRRFQGDDPPFGLSGEAAAVMREYAWPGNAREIEACIERACAAAVGDLIEPGDLTAALVELHARSRGRLVPGARGGGRGVPPALPSSPSIRSESRKPWELLSFELEGKPSLKAYERQALLHALHETNGDKLEAARLLEVGKSTFYRKLKAHDIS